MWYPSKIITAPSAEPVTLAQAKANLRVTNDVENDFIATLITAARAALEKRCNACFAEQTIQSSCSTFNDLARLPHGPLKSVISIEYLDTGGQKQTVDSSIYHEYQDGLEPSIGLKSGMFWPVAQSGSRITLTAVYGGDLRPEINQAIHLLTGAWYENREASIIGVSVGTLPANAGGIELAVYNNSRGV